MPYCSVTAFRSDSTSSISNIDLVRMYLLVDKKQVGSCFVSFKCVALVFVLGNHVGWFVRLRVLSGGNTRDVAATA